MYKIGDFIFVHCFIYQIVAWKSCEECAFGYYDECKWLSSYETCTDIGDHHIQFKFIREATDQECLDYADWDVMNKSDDGQLIML